MELTGDVLKYLVDNWDKKTNLQIAEHLGVSDATVSTWGSLYRKMGGDLPRKAGRPRRLIEEEMAKLILARGGKPLNPQTGEAYEFIEFIN